MRISDLPYPPNFLPLYCLLPLAVYSLPTPERVPFCDSTGVWQQVASPVNTQSVVYKISVYGPVVPTWFR